MANPIPRAAPVTTALFPAKSISFIGGLSAWIPEPFLPG